MSEPANLDTILEHLREVRAFDFTGYKRATLARRVHKRMQQLDIADHDAYLDHLQVHPEEFEPLFNTILINVTSFFRDGEVWATLDGQLDELVRRAGDREIRVWSAGCASGQEAYSILMCLAEKIGRDRLGGRVKVYATDVDQDALEHARLATYSARELESVPAELAERYFERAADGMGVSSELRRVVIFGRHDLLQDPPISRVDVLLCRNTLMYFNADVQSQLVARLHYSLVDGGILVLGKVESLLAQHGRFTPIEQKQRIFAKAPLASVRSQLLAIGRPTPSPETRRTARMGVAEAAYEHRETQEELEQTHRELETAYEELQSTNEELETTNEELQATVEELETTNEELQSTNEELETMNEELSSTNEEFQSINEELRDRTTEFNQISGYLESVLKSVEVSVVLVDTRLNVRVWNGLSFEMWGLRADEVEGRPFLTLDIGFPVEVLGGPIRTALTGRSTDGAIEAEAVSRRGHRIRCRARVRPLPGPGGGVDGAIVLISEVREDQEVS